jgi:hypothetical protein
VRTGVDDVVLRLAAAQHGVFHLRQLDRRLATASACRHRLRNGAWVLLYPGIYRLGGVPAIWQGTALAACWAGGDEALVSHRTAAALWDLPGQRKLPAEITCRRFRRAQQPDLCVHETEVPDGDGAVVDGVPVTSVARTLLDLGAVVPLVTVEAAIDAALRRELVTLPTLHALVDELGRSGRNGVGVLRQALDERGDRAPTESAMETLLLTVLRRNGLPTPVVQYVVTDATGFVARCDAAYPEARVAIEYESYEHHVGRVPLVRDSARRNRLIAAGWIVVTATAVDLRSGGDALCRAIRTALERQLHL